jgi:hypothetical protein
MKRKLYFISVLILMSSSLFAQYISKILEFRPAPGQFINLTSTGTPEAAESIKGPERGLVSLGSAGGYIVFQFDKPVINDPNHPYGVDFTLFGNPLPEWSEPGMVYVMKDENGNELADDTWYVLAGSDFFFSSTLKEHSIIYYEPGQEDSDIAWENNAGEYGFLVHNSFHQQPYYPGILFDAGFYEDNCQFDLIRISGNLDPFAPGAIKSYKRAFGYADNRPSLYWDAELPDNPYTWEQEGYGGDPFDLDWALNEQGQYIELDTVHFIKLQTSMYGVKQAVGEISTEITAGRLTQPVPGIIGENRILVIEDIPSQPDPGEYQLKAYYFENGKYVPDIELDWEVIEGNGEISTSGHISLTPGLEVTVRASLREGDISSQDLGIKIDETSSTMLDELILQEVFLIWPNPAVHYLNLELPHVPKKVLSLQIRDLSGRLMMRHQVYKDQLQLDISGLNPGTYFIILTGNEYNVVKKFLKR